MSCVKQPGDPQPVLLSDVQLPVLQRRLWWPALAEQPAVPRRGIP